VIKRLRLPLERNDLGDVLPTLSEKDAGAGPPAAQERKMAVYSLPSRPYEAGTEPP